MKAEQDPRFNMNNVDRDDLQKDFEEAAKRRIDELNEQSNTDKKHLKSEVDGLKREADHKYENIKRDMKDWDYPYADEKAEVEDASNKVVKKEIDADYQDSIDNIDYQTGHRVDSIERLMNEDMNKDYNKGVDAIYTNQSEDKFQHEKDHYANRKADDYSDKNIKASYDDIAEENASDRISGKSCGCGSAPKSDYYAANEKMDRDNLKESNDTMASSDKVKDYQNIYGGNSCKADITSDNLKNTSSDNLKNTSTTSQNYSDRIKDYTTEKPQGCGCSSKESDADKNSQINTRLKNSNIQDNNYQNSISDNNDDLPGYTITEEYVMIISDDASDDDNQMDSSDEYKSQIGQDSYNQQRESSSNQYEGMKCGSGSTGSKASNQQAYSKSNNIQDNTSYNKNVYKGNACGNDNLKQDILDEADRVMGDDMI